MAGSSQEELFAAAPGEAAEQMAVLNGRCAVRTREGRRIVVVGGLPVAQFAVDDAMAATYWAVTIVEQGWAQQSEVARVFECSTRTLRRAQKRLDEGGMEALGRAGGYPKGRPRLGAARRRRLETLKVQGLSNREAAQRLGVTENAVRKQLRGLGWRPPVPEQTELAGIGPAHPNVSAAPPTPPAPSAAGAVSAASPAPGKVPAGAHPNMSGSAQPPPAPGTGVAAPASAVPGADPNVSAPDDDEPLPVSFDTDPADRRVDRLFAHLGLLDDAAPLFRAGRRVSRAGVLLAVPALVHSGVFECARDLYGGIGPAFYGLRTTIVTLLLMALLRIKRAEALKEHAPDDLGRLLGLDRAPEVKTLRRKFSRLAALGCSVALGRALAQRRVAAHGAAMGFLYVDGHVRAYHGGRQIPGTHVARLRAAMPAVTDYWVGDQRGDPLFVVTAEANAGMVKMLPPVLEEVRALVGDERRITIVFDRGGWSPALFRRIVADGFDLLTYRKGPYRRIPENRFRLREAVLDGRVVTYRLADQGVRLPGGPRLRQVTMLCDSGHQTPILTSRRDLADIEVAWHMFDRWTQENLFKYLREEFAIDALVDYRIEEADPARVVPNPRWLAADHALREARADLARLAAQYGLAADANPEGRRRTMRGFKIANAAQGRKLREAMERCRQIESFRAGLPRRVSVQETVEGRPVIQLATERKHLTNLLKMVAYQAESELVRMVAPHYARADDEGRTLVQSALSSAADIEVTNTELRVTLAPLSSPHRTKALAAVCEQLDRDNVCFPGTRLRLRYAVTQSEPAT